MSQLRLVGAGGEPVDLWRTISSHGVADLPPNRIDDEQRTLEVTVPWLEASRGPPSSREGRPGYARVEVRGGKADARARHRVRHMLGLDADLSPFYELVADDPDLAWVAKGAGRMLRSPTVFEEVVKTICTTNCAWSGTGAHGQRASSSISAHRRRARRPGPSGARSRPPRRWRRPAWTSTATSPAPATAGPTCATLATSVADGELDLEAFAAGPDELPDDELAERLLALPGVGPYATAHIMMLLGRYSRLVLDSWTRPTVPERVRREERQGLDHRAPLPPVRAVRRARLLALPHP